MHRDPQEIHPGVEVDDDTSASVDLAAESHTRPARGGAASDSPQLAEAAALELRKEELVGRKQIVQTGWVLIRTNLVSETRTIEVPVTREELIVERLPPEQWSAHTDRVPATGDAEDELINRLRALQPGETVRIPLVEEEVVIELRPVVVEEVTIGTRQVQAMQQLSGIVRREEAHVEQIEAT